MKENTDILIFSRQKLNSKNEKDVSDESIRLIYSGIKLYCMKIPNHIGT